MKRSTNNKPVAKNLEQCLVGFTEKTRTSEVKTGGQSSQRCEQARRRVCGNTTTCSNAFHFVPCCIAWSWPLPRLVGCVGGILPRTIEEEVFVRPPKNMRKDNTIWTQLASSRWQRLVRDTLCDGHWKVLTCVPCVAYNETEDSLVMC